MNATNKQIQSYTPRLRNSENRILTEPSRTSNKKLQKKRKTVIFMSPTFFIVFTVLQ